MLGTGIAYAVLTAFSIGMTGSASPSFDGWMYAGVLGFATLLAALATLVPGRLALSGRPADVIGARQ